ncbi:MAG: F0F1 ATP synthase subunit A, partial [Pirellulales bacterium]|nr:F0F1 ATP synthase subunit A [Pirellulales bacterium]
MASNILHIKDSYHFEVPKALWRSHREARDDFPEYWVRLDPDYQDWEASKLYDALADSSWMDDVQMPSKESVIQDYHAWRGTRKHFAKPFTTFLEENRELEWFQDQLKADSGRQAWAQIKNLPMSQGYLAEYEETAPVWPAGKIEEYNHQLDGKILIPQPFGTLKNNYESASGFCISKFMVIELLVALILCLLLIRLAHRMKRSDRPRGKLWNMLEAILVYFRDEVARPAIGEHDAARFTPLLWTIFLFILGCNLFGMIPWMGAPTSAFGVTLGLALVTFATGLVYGLKQLGFFGYWKNLVPDMGLPW